jgi:hypothetical protein
VTNITNRGLLPIMEMLFRRFYLIPTSGVIYKYVVV